jgi:hypothetical protein
MGLPSLVSYNMPLSQGTPIAFTAVTSISVIGGNLSFSIPIFLRIMSKQFKQGPLNLGKFSKPIGIISIIWIFAISVIVVLPTSFGNGEFNYTGPILGCLLLIFGIWWLIDCKNWFKGPNQSNIYFCP